jgi:uncharacterized membrane protein
MTVIVILVAFLAGAAAGIAVLLRVGMAAEDSREPLVYEPAARSALATRCVVGLYVLTPRRASPAGRGQPGAGQRQLRPATAPRR